MQRDRIKNQGLDLVKMGLKARSEIGICARTSAGIRVRRDASEEHKE